MRQITFVLAALSLGAGVAAQAQEVRVVTPSPAVTVATSFGGSSLNKLGLTVSSGSERDTVGLLVVRIQSEGPAEKAGIVEGDRIMAINGTPLTLSAADAGEPDMALILRRRMERVLEKVEPEQEVTLRVWSGGRTREVKVRAGEDRRSRVGAAYGGGTYTFSSTRMGGDRPVIGVSLGTTGTKRDTLGVFIAAVVEGGPAEQAGIIEGHRIAAVNGVDLRVPAADAGDPMVASARANRLQREIEKVEPGARVQLRVWSDGRYRDVTVEAKRQEDVYKEATVRIGGVGAINSMVPNMIFGTSPSVIRLEPARERIESLDSLWRRREEIRRSVDPRFRRDTSATDTGSVYQFRIDDSIREAMERARIEMERVRQLYLPGRVIRTRTSA